MNEPSAFRRIDDVGLVTTSPLMTVSVYDFVCTTGAVLIVSVLRGLIVVELILTSEFKFILVKLVATYDLYGFNDVVFNYRVITQVVVVQIRAIIRRQTVFVGLMG